MTNIQESRAYQYCSWCTDESNHYIGIYVHKQAILWKRIADGEDDEAYIDEKQVRKITKLLKIIQHPDLG